MGIILVVDVTHPENFPRAIELMEKSRYNLPVPVVIAANKSDLPHEVTEEYIRSSLKLGPDVQIFFISALRKSDAIFVVESLIDSITRFP
jgi:signal recognition particle receptor subunit beta